MEAKLRPVLLDRHHCSFNASLARANTGKLLKQRENQSAFMEIYIRNCACIQPAEGQVKDSINMQDEEIQKKAADMALLAFFQLPSQKCC